MPAHHVQTEPARYREWIAYVFDRPDNANGWYFELRGPEFEAGDKEATALVIATLQRCGEDLKPFTDWQVTHGLHYIFNNACSSTVFSLMADTVPLELRREVIESMRVLYTDCFERRAAPVLSHRDEPGANPINLICYMLWDITPLAYWEGRPGKEVVHDSVLGVLEAALALNNVACQESALHGLGHVKAYSDQDRVARIIGEFLMKRTAVRPELASYARSAAQGCVL